ncbi:hypothetical protein [Bacillus sp. AK128]
MRLYSIFSAVLITLAMISFGLSKMLDVFFEPLAFIGLLALILGGLLGFISLFKQEIGRLKLVSISSFFIILYLLTWFESIQFIRILTWLKNIA